MIEIKALVADDDPQMQDIMVRRLQKAGLDPDRANDGRMALELIEQNDYDLIATDIYMPGATGLALLRRAKERDPYCQVIVVTAAATLDNAVEALNKGAFGYITKPFDHISVFNSMIARALEFRKLILANQRLAASQRRRGDLLEAEVTERVRRLRQHHKELMDLLGALPDGVLVIGEDGRIILRSPVAEEWLTIELNSETQPIRDFIVKAHAEGSSWETQVRLGEHLLDLRSEDLPAVDEQKRHVVIIREIGSQEIEYDSRLLDPLNKIRRSIDWLEKNQQRSDLSSSIEFLRLQISEIERFAESSDDSHESKADVQDTNLAEKDAAGVQPDSDIAKKDIPPVTDQAPKSGNGRTRSENVNANLERELTDKTAIDIPDKSLMDEPIAKVETEANTNSDPFATKLFSEEEVNGVFTGKPEIDPIEREKAFEKLIAMLEGGATAGVSGGIDPKNGAEAVEAKTEAGGVSARTAQDDTHWPPLPPSKEK